MPWLGQVASNMLKMIGCPMDDREIIGIGKFLTNHNLRYMLFVHWRLYYYMMKISGPW
jgi:hypothetical protein